MDFSSTLPWRTSRILTWRVGLRCPVRDSRYSRTRYAFPSRRMMAPLRRLCGMAMKEGILSSSRTEAQPAHAQSRGLAFQVLGPRLQSTARNSAPGGAPWSREVEEPTNQPMPPIPGAFMYVSKFERFWIKFILRFAIGFLFLFAAIGQFNAGGEPGVESARTFAKNLSGGFKSTWIADVQLGQYTGLDVVQGFLFGLPFAFLL